MSDRHLDLVGSLNNLLLSDAGYNTHLYIPNSVSPEEAGSNFLNRKTKNNIYRQVLILNRDSNNLPKTMLTPLNISQENIYTILETILDQLFVDGINWGRIVAFFSFGGALCVESADRNLNTTQGITERMARYLDNNLNPWIESHGGWGALLDFTENPDSENNLNYLLLSLISFLVLVLGFIFFRYLKK